MRVVFTVAGLASRFGGPSRSVSSLCTALQNQEAEAEIVALRESEDRRHHPSGCVDNIRWVDCHSRYLPVGWPMRFKRELRLALRYRQDALVHDAGLWLPSNRYAAQIARELGVMRVVSPRGMLSDWALNHGGARKKLAWSLYQRRDLETASLLHATAESEAEEFRNCGLRAAIAIVPNGVDLPPPVEQRVRDGKFGRTALFLSRIHPIKGLLDLIDAWAAVRPKGWRLVIAGNDEEGHRHVVEEAATEANLRDHIEFAGPVEGARKQELYREADLFILPSYSENFGISVAEALANSIPVITTRGTPWRELMTHNCGWWVETGVAPLAAALREAISSDQGTLREMGDRGRKLIQENYSWGQVAAMMKSVYEWLLDRSNPVPPVVSLPA